MHKDRLKKNLDFSIITPVTLFSQVLTTWKASRFNEVRKNLPVNKIKIKQEIISSNLANTQLNWNSTFCFKQIKLNDQIRKKGENYNSINLTISHQPDSMNGFISFFRKTLLSVKILLSFQSGPKGRNKPLFAQQHERQNVISTFHLERQRNLLPYFLLPISKAI
jgi:hypothetical protein